MRLLPAYTRRPMDVWSVAIIVLGVLLGSYVQAVTGFAMGMILIALASSTQALPIPAVTAVVSLLSLVNVTLALRGQLHHIEGRLVVWLAAGQLPAIWAGVALLERLHSSDRQLLELALGGFIVLGSLSMMLRPQPRAALSAPLACIGAGIAGGLLGGMFSASGPVIGWFSYRQPLPVDVIRATLLCTFTLTTSVRTLVVGVQGGLSSEVWVLGAIGLPLVLLGTWAGRQFRPPLSEAGMKRLAFGLLLSLGSWILARVLLSH